jgi:hypothetical protein
MTAQYSEELIYRGEMIQMCSEPLAMYFVLAGVKPEFQFTCTALWRGYVGTWEVIDDRLYMTGLTGQLQDGTEANLATVFPNFTERVFAHWFSDKVRIPKGKLLKYVHMGYASEYEEDLFLTFKKGVVTKTELIVNGEAMNPEAPEGYGIRAMTVFPSKAANSESGEG